MSTDTIRAAARLGVPCAGLRINGWKFRGATAFREQSGTVEGFDERGDVRVRWDDDTRSTITRSTFWNNVTLEENKSPPGPYNEEYRGNEQDEGWRKRGW